MPEYRTEDGVAVKEGDRAYDYYSMQPGVVGKDAGGTGPNIGWFDFYHDNGNVELLNGQRICSMAYARKRGFPKADPA